MKTNSDNIQFSAEDLNGLSDTLRKALDIEASRHTDKTAEEILSGVVNDFLFSINRAKMDADLRKAEELMKAFYGADPALQNKIASLLGVTPPKETEAVAAAAVAVDAAIK